MSLATLAVAAGAAWWARGAWLAQEKQVETQQKQLSMAKSAQEDQLFESKREAEISRRSEAPLFRMVEISAGNVSIEPDGAIVPGEKIITNLHHESRRRGNDARASSESSLVALPLENARTSVVVIEVGAVSLTEFDGATIPCMIHRLRDINLVESTDLFVLLYSAPKAALAQSITISVAVVFETSAGKIDTHIYVTKAGTSYWERRDPTSFKGVLDDAAKIISAKSG